MFYEFPVKLLVINNLTGNFMHFSNQKRRPTKRCRRGKSQNGCPAINSSSGCFDLNGRRRVQRNFENNSLCSLAASLLIYTLTILLCVVIFLILIIVFSRVIVPFLNDTTMINFSVFNHNHFFDPDNIGLNFNSIQKLNYVFKVFKVFKKLSDNRELEASLTSLGTTRKFTKKSLEELLGLFNNRSDKNVCLREVKRFISKMEKLDFKYSKIRKEKKLLSVKLKQRTDKCTLLEERLKQTLKDNVELLELTKTRQSKERGFLVGQDFSDQNEIKFIREKLELSKETSVPGKLIDVLLDGNSSFRSFSKIIKGLAKYKLYVGKYSPSPNTLINWMVRAGVSKLRKVEFTSEPCIDIIDHWIGAGDCKLFAVIRILHSKYQERVVGSTGQEGLKLSDFNLVHLEIVRKSNGEKVCSSLGDLYKRIGSPSAIISDSGSDLCKGIKLLNDQISQYEGESEETICHIKDISHKFACSFKKEYEKKDWFIDFFKELSSGNVKLQNTRFSYLKSAAQNTKARFMNIGKQVNWYVQAVRNLENNNFKSEDEGKFIDTYVALFSHNEKIKSLHETIDLSHKIMKIVKTKGLNKKTHKQCLKIIFSSVDGNPNIKEDTIDWLNNHLEMNKELVKRGWTSTMPVTSDPIESFFSKFKSFQKRVPQGDPTRLVAILPLIVGEISSKEINNLIRETSHKKSQDWVLENIPETIHSKKRKITEKNKPGNTKKRTKAGKESDYTKRPYVRAIAS